MARLEFKSKPTPDQIKVIEKRIQAGWESYLVQGEEAKVQALIDEHFPNTEGYKTPEHKKAAETRGSLIKPFDLDMRITTRRCWVSKTRTDLLDQAAREGRNIDIKIFDGAFVPKSSDWYRKPMLTAADLEFQPHGMTIFVKQLDTPSAEGAN